MFSSGRKSAGGGGLGRLGGKGATLSFIGPDVIVSGDVTGTSQLHIDGRVDGNVNCETLVQGNGGTIAGHIVADAAHLAGLVDGTVKARMVTLEPTARVTGDVTYETLSIAAGAAIEGRLSRKQDKPSEAPAQPVAALPQPSTGRKLTKASNMEEPGLLSAVNAPTPAAANAR